MVWIEVAGLAAVICLSSPVDGPVVEPYAPMGSYGGHWGVDFASDPGDAVSAPATGVVTFAGSVAGMKSVTIETLPGLKVSVSYLSAITTAAGAIVTRGTMVGSTGVAHGVGGLHMSVRVADVYVDPMPWLGCHETDVPRALRLVTPPQPYPRTRAHRNPRRDLRPDPYRPPPRGRDRSVRRPRPRHLHAGR